MICGIGIDLVDVERFTGQLARTPKLRDRLFTPAERELSVHSLAGRFAAKEALIKALGGSDGLSWQDLEVVRGERRAPGFAPTPALTRVLAARGAAMPWVSLAHDGNMAVATVVLETAVALETAAADPVSEVTRTLTAAPEGKDGDAS